MKARPTPIRAKAPNPKLIEQLEKMLFDAQQGEMQGFVGVVIFENGDTSETWVDPPRAHRDRTISGDRILGALERAKFHLLASRYGLDPEDSWGG